MNSKRTVTTYLVLERGSRYWHRKARVVKHSVNLPTLKAGQCAVKVSIEVDDAAFDPIFDVPPVTFAIGDTLRAQVTKEEL